MNTYREQKQKWPATSPRRLVFTGHSMGAALASFAGTIFVSVLLAIDIVDAGLSRLVVLLYLYSGSCFCNRTAYQLLVRYQATEPELCASLMIVSFGSPKFARSSFANWIMARMSGRYIQYVLTIY